MGIDHWSKNDRTKGQAGPLLELLYVNTIYLMAVSKLFQKDGDIM